LKKLKQTVVKALQLTLLAFSELEQIQNSSGHLDTEWWQNTISW